MLLILTKNMLIIDEFWIGVECELDLFTINLIKLEAIHFFLSRYGIQITTSIIEIPFAQLAAHSA